jgi:hypothetical protein
VFKHKCVATFARRKEHAKHKVKTIARGDCIWCHSFHRGSSVSRASTSKRASLISRGSSNPVRQPSFSIWRSPTAKELTKASSCRCDSWRVLEIQTWRSHSRPREHEPTFLCSDADWHRHVEYRISPNLITQAEDGQVHLRMSPMRSITCVCWPNHTRWI